ncbi:hypothetical protein [Acidovorax sp. SUPP2539]|uniref:hypothetical protein n=1 Tax=Acidovorax sp. SUPP2539 TaxID=2920878 RepID=UPI0023DE4865|nr:hypothetical protein [Acidovorax sp. SUPP2539]GKS92851.1 hypothetical protein AVTE2539_25820 [Acidovorax sp. SUPP2539]
MKTGLLRLLVGFLIAPAMPAALIFSVQAIFIGYENAAAGAFVFLIIGYASALVLGVPIHFFLQSKKLVGLGSYLLLGAIIGIAYYVVVFIPTYLAADSKYVLDLLRNTVGFGLMGLVGGLISSLVFWFIAVRARRPVIPMR